MQSNRDLSTVESKIVNLRASIGYKRILTFLFPFTFSVIWMLYARIIIDSFTGNPPFARITGNAYNFICHYGLTIGTYVFILSSYISAFLPKITRKKSILGLALASNNPKILGVTRKQWMIRCFAFATILLIIYSLGIWVFISGFSYFILSIIFFWGRLLVNGVSLESPESVEIFTNKFFHDDPIILILSHIPVFLFFYFIFVNTWKRRGLPDIIAGTKVVEGLERFKTKTLVIIFLVITLLTAAAYPFGLYLESTFPRTQESYDQVISAERKEEYKNPSGWSIFYDSLAVTPYYLVKEKRTGFILNLFPSSCIFEFYVSEEYDNPQNLSFDEFRVWMKETRGWEVFTQDEGEIIENVTIDGQEAQKITYINNNLKPITNDNRFNLKKSVYYYVNVNKKIYKLSYDIADNEYSRKIYDDRYCKHVETEVQKMMESFKITK